jgi:hypothetical protein
MARAIGNPDTAADSQLSAALDAAIKDGDDARVEEMATAMQDELASGRRFAAVAGGWQPGAAAMVQLDRLIVAFQAMVEAKRAAADEGLAVVDAKGQQAFMDAGGLDAWHAMINGSVSIPSEGIPSAPECRWWEAGAPLPTGGAVPTPVS